ncbi:hypothetical protein AYI70_g8975, partial [Smittium culicis]|jgi:hypothetical protein
MNGI